MIRLFRSLYMLGFRNGFRFWRINREYRKQARRMGA